MLKLPSRLILTFTFQCQFQHTRPIKHRECNKMTNDDLPCSHNGDKEERCYVSGRLDGTAKYYYTRY